MFCTLSSNQWKWFLCSALSCPINGRYFYVPHSLVQSIEDIFMFRTLSSNSFLLFYYFDTYRQMICFHFSIWITAVKCRGMLHARSGTARASVFCYAKGLGLLSRVYFAPRRVWDCFPVGILLRAGFGTARAWVFCSAQSLGLLSRGDFAPHPPSLLRSSSCYACLSGVALPLTPV